MRNNSYYIETYGCQMNEYDSLVAQRLLDEEGSTKVDAPEQADLILLNTCAIRENAHTKVFNRLRSLEHLHKNGARIGVLGCMVQNLREEITYQNLPLDFILGPDELRQLTTLSKDKTQATEPAVHLKLSRTELYDDVVPTVEHHLNSSKDPLTAFVTIQRGCDNFCSFCVVPYTRGRERSRPAASIVDEARALNDEGVQSIVLLGQNVNSYSHANFSFTNLVEKLLVETQIPRIYFTSPHPKDFPHELIELMAAEPRFCNQVHMPLQAGSDDVLKRMKRNYTSSEFLDLVGRFRERVDDVAISTDIIVGFPGESASQHEETIEVMKKADFDSAFMFAYSERKGTIANKLYDDDVPADTKKERLQEVINNQLERSLRRNQQYLGKRVEVMIHSTSRRSDDDLVGRMRNGRKVVFPALAGWQPGDLAQIDIKGASSATLTGIAAG